MKPTMKLTILLTLTFLGICSARAQYSAEWSEFDAGTASHQATGISHAGTFSGWLRTPMQSANYESQQGHPTLPIPVQTPGLPALTITRAGNNVRVAWPASATDFTLQEADTVDGGAVWSDIPGPYPQSNDECYLLVPATDAAVFYRLMAP